MKERILNNEELNRFLVRGFMDRVAFSRYKKFLDMQDNRNRSNGIVPQLKYDEGEILLDGESLANLSLVDELPNRIDT